MSQAADRQSLIARLREQAALERRLLAAQIRVVAQETHGVAAVAGSIGSLARGLLGASGGAAGPLVLLGRLGLAPLALKVGRVALRSRAGRWALVAGAVGAAVWWWRGRRD